MLHTENQTSTTTRNCTRLVLLTLLHKDTQPAALGSCLPPESISLIYNWIALFFTTQIKCTKFNRFCCTFWILFCFRPFSHFRFPFHSLALAYRRHLTRLRGKWVGSQVSRVAHWYASLWKILSRNRQILAINFNYAHCPVLRVVTETQHIALLLLPSEGIVNDVVYWISSCTSK